jgi:small-conductance mechanosensitive channel
MTELEVQILETIVLGSVIFAVKIFTQKSVNRFLNRFEFDLKRKRITQRIINLFLTIFAIIILAGIWNIKRDELIVFLTSVITVLGIAFFAQWSILSNITSSLILFFNHPLKIGQNVRVLDKEFDIEGQLIDISFFFMYVRDQEGNLITIPTSVVLQKTIVSKGKPRRDKVETE